MDRPPRPSPTNPGLRADRDRLSVALDVADDRVVGVGLESSRRADVARVLIGQPVGAAVRLVGLLFSLCGVAQTVAAVQAAEAATGARASSATNGARHAVVLCEAVEQSVLRLGMDWPAVAGTAPDIEAVRDLRHGVAAARRAASVASWDRIGGAAAGARWPPPALGAAVAPMTADIRALVFGDAPVPETEAALADLAASGRGSVSGALALALDDGAGGVADAAVAPLRDWDLGTFAARLSGSNGLAFAARPDWRGAPAETGALARLDGHPLVAGLRARGAGLAARLAARLLDLDRMLAALADLAHGAAAPPPAALSDGPGRGLSAVDTARGLLVHRVTLDGGRVADWRIVAPTEWTFHPDGALARVPLGWPAGDRTALLRRVRLLVAAMDPCVAHDVAIREAAHA
ncbi:hypothetical protein [Rhodospira trueperi]|uniref:Coenzyme F420-reducing hydrogenase, alpha subunit n=1 Tax=Rhodospira trueperi TaxID=69960 RepID=A0A1G6YM35_9PROT|nr:hypothetical protein [Rhodospira trueperi]SDD91448.1 Coenzyme F420-reducing hydrogenase, alpha subunit [Rhodospira trueperi]